MTPPVPAPRATVDTEADAAYLTLHDGTAITRTFETLPGCVVDLDSTGRVVGVELLAVSHGCTGHAVEALTEQFGVPGWLLWETARRVGWADQLRPAGGHLRATWPLDRHTAEAG